MKIREYSITFVRYSGSRMAVSLTGTAGIKREPRANRGLYPQL